MDLATVVGIVLAFGAVIGSMVMEGGNPAALFSHPAPLMLVFGGTIGAAMSGYTMKDMANVPKAAIKAFMPGEPAEPTEAIEQMVRFADRARRDGLLALEDEAKGI